MDDTVRAACYSYILEGRYSNLPPVRKNGVDSFWRVAASNQEQDHCNVNNTSLALLRRFAHINVIPNITEVLNYFQEKDVDTRVLSYLATFNSDLFPAKWDEKLLEEKANPFPSTWEMTSRLIKDVKNNKEIYSIAAACVGPMVASKFKGFLDKIGKISVEELLKSPKEYIAKITKENDSSSLLYALIYEVADLWKKTEKIKVPVLIEIEENLNPEFATALIMMTIKHRTQTLKKEKRFQDLLKKLGNLLVDLEIM